MATLLTASSVLKRKPSNEMQRSLQGASTKRKRIKLPTIYWFHRLFFLYKLVYTCVYCIILCLWEQKVTDPSTAFQKFISLFLPLICTHYLLFHCPGLTSYFHRSPYLKPSKDPQPHLPFIHHTYTLWQNMNSVHPVLHLLWDFLEAAELKVAGGKKKHTGMQTDLTLNTWSQVDAQHCPPITCISLVTLLLSEVTVSHLLLKSPLSLPTPHSPQIASYFISLRKRK